MQHFPIKVFRGIDTSADSTDQDRGTLRRADGILCEPAGAICSGPTWGSAWGLSTLATSIAAALSGADPAKVHFVTVSRSGHTLLIAWDLASARPRGLWHVAGSGTPTFSATSGASITATSGSVYRDKTAALPWYGSWIGNRLILGNGTDANLVWESGALALLFPSAATNAYDENKVAIPPCKSFVADAAGILYAAGNVTNPLFVYVSAKPSASAPKPYGVLDTDMSFVKVLPPAGGTAITALSVNGPFVVAHLDEGGAVALYGWEQSGDGYKCLQAPLDAAAGAINPSSTYDRDQGPLYLGSDLEVYRAPRAGGWRLREDRSVSLATAKSAGDWNAQMSGTVTPADTFTVWNTKSGHLWIFAPLSVGRQGTWIYSLGANAATGPFRYPDLLAVSRVRDPNLAGCQVVGLSRSGALLWADLDAVGAVTLPTPSEAQGADYTESAVAVVNTTGLPGVEIDATNEVFRQTLDGETVHMNGVWSDFVATTAPEATAFYKNAYLAVVDIADEDCGSPRLVKDFCNVVLQWERNQRVYVGVAVEADSRDFRWFGCNYPYKEMVIPVVAQGTRIRIRLILVFFNGSRAVLPDVSLDFLSAQTGR